MQSKAYKTIGIVGKYALIMFGKKVVFLHIKYIHVYLLSLISYKPEYGNYNKLKKISQNCSEVLGIQTLDLCVITFL